MCIYHSVSLCAFVSLHSDEADDSAGECGAEPEHSPGQHPETVRGREEQDRRQTSQREAGTAATEEEGGRSDLIFKGISLSVELNLELYVQDFMHSTSAARANTLTDAPAAEVKVT